MIAKIDRPVATPIKASPKSLTISTELFPLLTTMCVRAYSHLRSNLISLTEIREVSWQSGDYCVPYVPTGSLTAYAYTDSSQSIGDT